MMNTWFNIDKVTIDFGILILIISKASIEGVASPVKGKTKLKSSKSQAHKNEENQDEEVTYKTILASYSWIV